MTCTDVRLNTNKRRRPSDTSTNDDTESRNAQNGELDQAQKQLKRQRLYIEIPTSPPIEPAPSSVPGEHAHERDEEPISGLSDPDSLFDSPSYPYIAASTAPTSALGCSSNPAEDDSERRVASRSAPPVPGLFFDPSLRIPQDISEEVMKYCMETYFRDEDVNQVMLFERAPEPGRPPRSGSSSDVGSVTEKVPFTGLPPVLVKLLSIIEELLLPTLPAATQSLLFPSDSNSYSPNAGRARQAIVNLYRPGEGITPHVDLLKRFGDGIIGASFGSGCVMQFSEVQTSIEETGAVPFLPKACDVYLPERSVIVLSKDARYKWTHGIGKHKKDLVENEAPLATHTGEWIPRGTRLSITFRYLLPGAEVVGDIEDKSDEG